MPPAGGESGFLRRIWGNLAKTRSETSLKPPTPQKRTPSSSPSQSSTFARGGSQQFSPPRRGRCLMGLARIQAAPPKVERSGSPNHPPRGVWVVCGVPCPLSRAPSAGRGGTLFLGILRGCWSRARAGLGPGQRRFRPELCQIDARPGFNSSPHPLGLLCG